jgi:thiamine-phosphate pyrophosphorylase
VPRLHVIVVPTREDPALVLTRTVLDAGAPLVQIRVKGASDREQLRLVEPLVTLAHEFGARAVVNDRADVCVATRADGVHGGADDLGVAPMRAVVGADRLVGGTARDPATAAELAAAGADYLGVGPVYATTSKTGLPAPIGVATIERVVAATDVPVIAIAGITVERVTEVVGAGAHGVAVISAIVAAPDPGRETRRFLDALEGR